MTATATPVRQRRTVPLNQLTISPLNSRNRLPARVADMAKTVKAVGVIIPPIARPTPGAQAGHFEILDGGYRLLSAQKAGVTEMDVDVEECDDERARQIILTSTERVDMHPLDQSEQVMQLLPKLKTEKRVGAALGKSEAWVSQRSKLAGLSDDWKAAWRNPDTDLLQVSLDGWQKLAAEPGEIQAIVYKNATEYGSLSSSGGDRWGDEFITTPWIRQEIGSAKQGVKKIEFADQHAAAGRDAALGTRGKAEKAKPAVPLKQRREQLQKRRLALVMKGIIDLAGTLTTWPKDSPLRKLAAAGAVAAVCFGTEDRQAEAGSTIYADFRDGKNQFGPEVRKARLPADPWDRLAKYQSTHDLDAALAEHCFEQVAPVMLKRLGFYQVQNIDLKIHGREAEEICRVFCLDYHDLCSQAERDLPEPASWAKLNADGTPKADKPAKKPAKKAEGKSRPKAKAGGK